MSIKKFLNKLKSTEKFHHLAQHRRSNSKGLISLGVNKNNNEREVEEETPRNKRKTYIKQSTMANPDLDSMMVKDLLNPEFTKNKMTTSFKHQPNKEVWKLSIYELGKKQFHVFDNKITANYNIPIIPEDETLIVCVNFSSKELKMLLIDRLNINPIMYSE